jgi:Protein of unknown function (DUF1257)
MSHFSTIKTKITNAAALAEALDELFNARGVEARIEVFDKPQSMQGYYGDKGQQSAEVIVRNQSIGSKADLGYRKEKDGTYSLIWDEYEFQRGRVSHLDLADLPRKILQPYAKFVTLQAARQNGDEVETVQSLPNGSVRITLTRPKISTVRR